MSVRDPNGTADPTGDGASVSGPRACVKTLESCAFVWFFDLNRRRFRRVPVGTGLPVPAIPATWTDYFDLQVDEDPPTFRVSLNADRTSILRSSYHAGPCLLCARRRPLSGISRRDSTSGSGFPVDRSGPLAPSTERRKGDGRAAM